MNINIVNAEPKQLPELYKLYRANGKYFGFVSKVEMLDSMNRGYMWSVLLDDTIQGFVRFNKRKDGVIVIYEIILNEECRGLGIGKMIINKLPKPIFAKCPQGYASNNFYSALGFKLQGVSATKKGTMLNEWLLKSKSQRSIF